jgi:hypothetical protein
MVHTRRFVSLTVLALASLALLPGCNNAQSSPGAAETPYFVPPTLPPPTAVVQPTATPQAQQTSVASCVNSLKYVNDVTIPDNTTVHPGDTLNKQWEVENNGTCNWTSDYSLHLISGSNLGAGSSQALYPALAGSSATIQITFVVPSDAQGSLASEWQAYDPSGQPFGDYISIQVKVTP